ncbi:amino acid ABC transporter ATP-binding/permease protein [Promicromonospora sukumoe]|uniref:amino acid ABC transporter ATP-binding/permease protein n=1 Tax=Promicromonospora sukumoe TaxID=88382 RepID=UPI00365BE450
MTTPLTADPARPASPALDTRDPLRRVLPLLEVRPGKVAAAVALGVLALACAIGLAAVAAWLVARASQMPPVLTLSVAVVSVRAFGIGRGVLRYCERLASHDVALRGMAALRANLYARLAADDRPVTVRRGELLARIGQDVDDVGDVVVRAMVPAGVAAVTSLGSVILLGVLLPAAGVALAVCLVLAGIVTPWLAARAAARTEARGAAARGEVSALSLELLEESAALRVAGRFDARVADLDAADARLSAVADDGARTSGLAAALGALAQGLAVLASLAFGIPAALDGSLSPEALTVIVLTPLAVFEATAGLPAAAVQLHRSREAARRLLGLLPETPASTATSATSHVSDPQVPRGTCGSDKGEVANETAGAGVDGRDSGGAHVSDVQVPRGTCGSDNGEVADETAGAGAVGRDSTGTHVSDVQVTPGTCGSDTSGAASGVSGGEGGALLVLDDVAAGWPGADGRRVAAVEGVSLTLRPGSVVALAGPSGVGKTTLLMTAAGLIPAVSGGIGGGVGGGGEWSAVGQVVGTPDYRSPDELPTAELTVGARSGGGDAHGGALFVAEDGHVFDTTVLENLRVARGDVTPDEARAALDAVGLGDWLAALPAGLDTVVGTDAAAVSGGERRRLLVARALLAPARVLLVDEPAEHLDGATADALVDAVADHARATGRAVLLATHRLTPLGVADEVLLLAQGTPTPDVGPVTAEPGTAGAATAGTGAVEAGPAGSGAAGLGTTGLGAAGAGTAGRSVVGAGVGPGAPAIVAARGRHEDLLAADPAYAWAAAQEG